MGDEFLRAEIEGADRGLGALRTYHGEAGDSTGFLRDRPLFERHAIRDVIRRSAGVPDSAAEDIRRLLEDLQDDIDQGETDVQENPFAVGSHYARKESVYPWSFETDWDTFETSVKTESRYFNRTAEQILTRIFDGIDAHSSVHGRPVIVDAGPGTEFSALYRARVFQSERKLREAMKRPDKDLGPPPSQLAIAGRMNAAGVTVFYSATEGSVALAEVRPPVGSWVLVGRFEVIQPLRLLCLRALEKVQDEEGSIFDAGYVLRLEKAAFLRGLGLRISKPVMPDDQPRDYLPTQAIADFLAGSENPPLDGIIYPSVQTDASHLPRIFGAARDKLNVVLFHKSARVQELDIPEDAEISVSDNPWFSPYGGMSGLDDESEIEYFVREQVMASAAPIEPNDAPLRFSSLEVHSVKGVVFNTLSGPVHRSRAGEPGQEVDS